MTTETQETNSQAITRESVSEITEFKSDIVDGIIEAAKKAAEKEAKRIANKKHISKIDTEVYEDLTQEHDMHPKEAEDLVRAIKSGQIRNVTINY